MLRHLLAMAGLAILLQAPIARADEEMLAMSRLKSCDAKVAIAAAEEVVNSQGALQQPFLLFEPAQTLFDHGRKDEGLFWFYAAQLRVQIELAYQHKGDGTQVLVGMQKGMGPIMNNYGLQNVVNFDTTLDRVLEWDRKTPNPFRSKPKTADIDRQVQSIYAALQDLQIKVAANRIDVEAKSKAAAPAIALAYARSHKIDPRCRPQQAAPAS